MELNLLQSSNRQQQGKDNDEAHLNTSILIYWSYVGKFEMGFGGITNSECVEGLLYRKLVGNNHLLSKQKQGMRLWEGLASQPLSNQH